MHDEASTEKWITALSQDGVGFKVWDNSIDLELDSAYAGKLTDAFDGDLVITPLPVARAPLEGDPFLEMEASTRAPLVVQLPTEATRSPSSDSDSSAQPQTDFSAESASQVGTHEATYSPPASEEEHALSTSESFPAPRQDEAVFAIEKPDVPMESQAPSATEEMRQSQVQVNENQQAQPVQPAQTQQSHDLRVSQQTARPKKEKPVIVIDNKYQIASDLGKGVMCHVFKVKDLSSGSLMVMKVLPKEAWNDQAILQRAQAESKILTALQHDNLVTFRCLGSISEGDGRPYVLMDYLHGLTLVRAIKATDGLPLPRVVQVFEQLCRGLSAVHSAGIPHRDIRPENIMFLSKKGDYNLKLVDFGLAKLISEGMEPMKRLEATGDIFGSPPYMSPEECRGEKIDARSDIYSLGCVIYTAMTGQPPFAGSSSNETLKKQIGENLPAPSKIKRSICSAAKAGWVTVSDLEYIVMRCLEKNPDNRYQTVEQILSDIEKLRQSIPLQQTQQKAASGLRTTEVADTREEKPKYVAEMLGSLLYVVIAVVIVASAAIYFFMMPKAAPKAVPTEQAQAPAKVAPESKQTSPNPKPPNVSPDNQLPPAPVNTEDPTHRKIPPTPPMEMPEGTY